MKRLIDIVGAFFGLCISAPILIPVFMIVWLGDFKSPFYIAPRVGKGGAQFKMVKIRSMIVDAHLSGVDSTSNNDLRITKIGRIVRRYKLDELTQLWNVLMGDMSLVGPRPNVERETRLYTGAEKILLSVRPGITDFASIVFSDEGSILANCPDPDISYHQLIRPGKGELGIFYTQNSSNLLDIKLCLCTVASLFSRQFALKWVQSMLKKLNAPDYLIELSGRHSKLEPRPPYGGNKIVTERQ